MVSRKIIPFFADTHGGHKLGLMNPEAEIWDFSLNEPELTKVPEMNAWQELMWEDYIWGIDEVKKLAGEDEVIPYHVGDITQGDIFTNHLVTQSLKNQALIGMWNMKPWMEEIKQIRKFNFISGTPLHIGFEGTTLLDVYERISKDYEDVEFRLSHHAFDDIGKEKIDVAHHGPYKGTRKWLEGNQLRYYLKDIIIDALMSSETYPRVVVRAHYHTPDEETITEQVKDIFHRVTGIIVPSFSGMNGHGRKATKSKSHITNGMCCIEVIDGKFERTHWFTRTRDIRTERIL